MDFWKDDPGPCPVDDAPHTTCTSHDPIVVRHGAHQTCTVPLPTPRVFTTATYRRAQHGPAAARVVPAPPAQVPGPAPAPPTRPAKTSERRRGR